MNEPPLYDMAMRQIAEWHRQLEEDRRARLVAPKRSGREGVPRRIRRGFALALAAAVALLSQTR